MISNTIFSINVSDIIINYIHGCTFLSISFDYIEIKWREEKKGKRKGYKIFNSSACLKGVYKDNWVRPSKICYVYADNKLYQCCRAFGNDNACKNCGYLGYPEIIYILKLKPSAIISALKYLPRI